MLANQLAEAVADLGSGAVYVFPVHRLGRELLRLPRQRSRFGKRPDLLDRADPDAIGLAQGPVDCSGFGNAHLGATYQGRDIGGIGIAVANEAVAFCRLEDSSPKCPPTGGCRGKFGYGFYIDARTALSSSQTYQACVSDIPTIIQKDEIASNDRETEFLRVGFEVLNRLGLKGSPPFSCHTQVHIGESIGAAVNERSCRAVLLGHLGAIFHLAR